MRTPQQGSSPPRGDRRANLRLALVLASIALAFLVGFVVKATLFGA